MFEDSLHDFNLAAEYADKVFVMCAGELVCEGSPEEVLCPGTMRDVFHLEVAVSANPHSGRPLVIPLHRAARPDSVHAAVPRTSASAAS